MKKIILYILIFFLFFTTGVFASNLYREYIAKETDYMIEINGEQQIFELPIVTIEDRTYVALRLLGEKLGYHVDWIEKERKIKLSNNTTFPIYEDLTVSQEGVLSDGTKYNFIANENFSYQEQVNQWGLTSCEGSYGEIPTAKQAAEIGKILLGYSDNESSLIIQVYFDNQKDVWFVYGLDSGITHSGLRTVVLQRSDGKVLDKYELR